MRTSDVRAVYGWLAVSRWLFLVAMVSATLGVVPMLVGVAVAIDSTPWRIGLAVACLLWLAGAPPAVWRTALTIRITDRELRWQGALRGGTLPLAAVRSVRPVPILGIAGWHALVADGQRPVWVLVARGFDDFVDDLRGRGVPLDVRLGWAAARPDRIPGRNQYRRIDGGHPHGQ